MLVATAVEICLVTLHLRICPTKIVKGHHTGRRSQTVANVFIKDALTCPKSVTPSNTADLGKSGDDIPSLFTSTSAFSTSVFTTSEGPSCSSLTISVETAMSTSSAMTKMPRREHWLELKRLPVRSSEELHWKKASCKPKKKVRIAPAKRCK